MSEQQPFWKGVFSDAGEPSFSRVGTAFLLFFACGWVTAIVFKHYALPDFGGLVMFVGVLYAINKTPQALGVFTSKQEPPKQ